MDPKIFKAYDIRGVYPEEINEDAAYKIGRAIVTFLKCERIVVGRDMRVSSPALFESLTKGITDQGADVIDIGLVTWPMVSFTIMHFKESSGLEVSASHSPAEYNGFKVIKNGGESVLQLSDEDGLEEISEIALEGKFEEPTKKGRIEQKDIKKDYQEYLLARFKDISNLKVICDYGNGIGAVPAEPVLNALPVEAVHLFKEPDGSFPNHMPNPHEIENFKPLQEEIQKQKADLGIFFDGDGDRGELVDENGEIIFPDVELGALALDELSRNPGKKVFYDLRFTKAVAEEVEKAGGQAFMLRVGNPFYKEAMLDEDALVAGELSGHIFFKEHYGIDDGLYSALKFMSLMNRTGKKASELVAPFKKYFQTEEINMKVADADETIEKVRNKYSDGKLITIDGILIDYGDWWLSLRKSNTEPLVRLRIEAKSKELLEEKRKEVLKVIQG
ncbi:MAG: phosphomannomutase/phosphoglucomutase [Parcubacteria group bacterium]|jgi:phosphomannomutase